VLADVAVLCARGRHDRTGTPNTSTVVALILVEIGSPMLKRAFPPI
jgi:hypothetical protein